MLASNKPQSNRKVETRSTKSTRQSKKAAILKPPQAAAVVDNPIPLNLTGTGDTSTQLPSSSDIPALVLTPTTYSRLEQTLFELTPQLVPASARKQTTSTALKPMAIKRDHDNNNDSDIDDDDDDTFTGDDSVSGDDWGSSRGGGKSARLDVAVDYSLSSSNHSSSAETSGPTASSAGKTGPRRHTGPRKPRTHEKLSAAEEERRRQRRERNKHAAAKCRQKRVDLTNELLAETEQLESEQAKLQNEIKAFQREKDELEFILEAHRLHCGTNKIAAVAATAVKQEPAPAASGNILFVVAPPPVATETVITTTAPEPTVAVMEKPTVTIRRPTSLATVRFGGTPQIAGVAITTPSAGLNVYTLGLESMIDGHTGLTPITGLPVISFAGLSTPIVSIPTSGGMSMFGDAVAAIAAGIGNDTPVITATTSS